MNQPGKPGWMGEFAWFGASAVLPCASAAFYRHAARRSLLPALVFFTAFMLVISLLSAGAALRSLEDAADFIRQQYRSGEAPTIRLRRGEAHVDAPQPMIWETEDGGVLILDTTGSIFNIDRQRYTQGFLLTRTELHVLSRTGRYQIMPLSQLQLALGSEEIILNESGVLRLWQAFTGIFGIVAFLAIIFWNLIGRLAWIAILAVCVWSLARLLKRSREYLQILILGIYAYIPAFYLAHLLEHSGVTFCGMQTLLHLLAWGAALLLTNVDPLAAAPPAPRLWRAWIGVPFLLLMMIEYLTGWPQSSLALWVAALLTVVALGITGWMAHSKTTNFSIN